MEFNENGWSIDGMWRQYGKQLISRAAWERKLARGRERYSKNKEHHNRLTRDWYSKNRELALKKGREDYIKKRPQIRARERARYEKDPIYRLRRALRRATQKAIKRGWERTNKTTELIGCTKDELRRHIESQFQPGMTWENYGFRGWHVDHIIPVSSIDPRDPEQVKRILHWTNLQPLWWRDNIRKGNRVSG